MTREERIKILLEHLEDYDPALGDSEGGRGDRIPEAPLMNRHRSVRELHRTLGALKECDRTAWWHVMGWYQCEWRNVDTVRRVLNRKGKPIHPPCWEPGSRERRRVLLPWVKEAVRDRGVSFVVREFRGDADLPRELVV